MSDRPTVRVFISSPSDVRPERLKAERIVERLNNEFAYHFAVEPVLWEREPLVATHHFQHADNIPQPHRADIVVVILWTRLGVVLPADQFQGALSGRAVTGTEWEFEDALASARNSGTPDLLLYRKDAPPTADLTDRQQLQDRLTQLDLLEDFIGRWFRTQDGQGFTAASHSFDTVTAFEDKLYEHLRALLERKAGAATDGVQIRWHGPPFRGLAPFEQAQSAVFFGRTRARNELRELLARRAARGPAFVLVLGASGSGKSSLVQAGLLPDLTLPGMVGQVALVRQAALRPSNRPHDLLGDLADALLAPGALPELATLRYTPPRLAELLRRGPDGVALPVEQGLAVAAQAARLPAPAEARLVLVVDQLEELFTTDALDPAERAAFVDALDALARTGLVWVVATMRSDFFDRLELVPALARLADSAGCYRLLPPDAAELAQIIRQPAREAGLRFAVDPALGLSLDEAILQGASRDRGALPLLSFVLDQLWQQRTPRGELTFAAYASLGGLEGALGRHAEAVFAAQEPALQDALPALLRGLVTLTQSGAPGAPATVAARTAPLDRFADGSPARGLVLAFLQPAARLLVADDRDGGTPRLRVAHEALLTHWPRARDWIADRPADLLLEDRIEAEAARWADADAADRPSLLRPAGLPLSEAQDLLARRRAELGDVAVAYVTASVDADAARQAGERDRAAAEQALRREAAEAEAARQRGAAEAARRIATRTRVGLAVACALLAVAAGLAWLSVERTGEARAATAAAETRLADARLNASRFATERAERELRVGHPELAALMARTALPDDMAHPDRPLWYPAASVIGEARSADHLLAVLPHAAYVNTLAVSPDGSRAVTGSEDRMARVWDVATGRLLAVLAGHTGSLVTAAFSPDGARVVTGSLDRTARLWDVRTGAPVAVLAGHAGIVTSAVFSPDGALIATGSFDRTVRLWDGATGAPGATLRGHDNTVQALAWSPDGKRLASASYDKTARVWDVAAAAQQRVLQEDAPLYGISWSPAEDSVLTQGDSDAARLWDADTGELQEVFTSHEGRVMSAAFSPDGSTVATGPAGGAARIWATDGGKELHRLAGGPVARVAFARDGTALAGSAGEVARVWDVASGEVRAVLQGHRGFISTLVVTPDGKRLLTASADGTARIWDIRPVPAVVTQDDETAPATRLAWSPDGKRFASASDDGVARVWDAAGGRLLAVFRGHAAENALLAWSPDGQALVSAASDNSLRIWDAATGAQRRVLNGHTNTVTSATFSPDGRRVLTASWDKTVRVWDAQTGAQTLQIAMPASPVFDARFSPDGARIASGELFNSAHVWNAADGTQVAAMTGHTSAVTRVAWNPDGTQVLTGSNDGTARVWNAATGAAVAVLSGTPGLNSDVGWSGDGSLVVLSASGVDSQVWRAGSWNRLLTVPGVPALSPDGRRIASVSDGTGQVWDAATGAVLAVFGGYPAAVAPVAWSPDGRRLLTAAEGRTARNWPVWPLFTADTVAYADIANLRAMTDSDRAALFLDSIATVPDGDPCDAAAADPRDPRRRGAGVPFGRIDADRAATACRAAVQAAPGDTRLRYQLGRALDRRGDAPGAVEAYRAAADGGDAPAAAALGLALQFGKGVAADPAAALALFKRADAGGFAPAAFLIGQVLWTGAAGVPQDRTEAVRWINRGAARGDATALASLGLLTETGDGVPRDLHAALRYDAIAKRLLLASGDSDDLGVLYRCGALARTLDPAVAALIAQEAAEWRPDRR